MKRQQLGHIYVEREEYYINLLRYNYHTSKLVYCNVASESINDD